MSSAMARETAEIPRAAARLLAKPEALHAAAEALRRLSPSMLLVCGRGSSGHAGTHLQRLVEVRLGIPAVDVAPSVTTVHGRLPAAPGAALVVISQSGGSPDLVAVTNAARAQGILTIALVNDEASALAGVADLVAPLTAGPEMSVAATKSAVNGMLAATLLVALWAGDDKLMRAIDALPARLSSALALDWSAWSERLADAPAGFVTARGLGLSAASEIALKAAEVLRVPTLAYSAAELWHGPRAAVSAQTPVLALRLEDGTATTVDSLSADLRAAGAAVFSVGGAGSTLPWIEDDDPACDPLCWLPPAYLAIERAAIARGFDPDRPPFLQKVTRTL